MPSIGEISVDVVAKTDGFIRSMKDAAFAAGGTKAAMAGMALAAGTALAGVASLTAAAGALVKKVAASGDAAAKASQQIGISAEAYQEFGHAMELSGENIETLRKGLLRMARNTKDAADGLKAPAEAFDELGISVKNADGSLKDVEQLVPELANKFSKMEGNLNKAALAQEIFGKAGAKMIPFLNAGADGIAKMRQEARDLGIVISNEAAKKAEEFNDTLDRLNKAFEGVKVTIGSELLPAFTELASIALEVTKGFLDSVPVAEYMRDGLKGLALGAISVIEALDAMAPAISGVGTAIGVASNLGQIWMEGFFAIGKVIAGVSAKIREFVTGALSGLIGAGSEVAAALGYDGLAGALKTAEKGIGDVARAVGGVGDAAFDSLGNTIDSVAEDIGDIDKLLSKLAKGETTSALRETLNKIKEGLRAIGDASLESAKEFDEGAESMVKSAKKVEEAVTRTYRPVDEDPNWTEKQAGLSAAQAGAAYSSTQQGTSAAAMSGIAEFATMLTGGLVPAFTDLWKGSESFSKALEMANSILDKAFGPFIEGIGQNLVTILEPFLGIMEALAPAFDVLLTVLNPIVLPLKVLAGLFDALAKPINRFIRGIKQAFVSLINVGRKRENKAYVTDDGRIIDPKGKFGEEKNVVTFDETAEAAGRAGDALDGLAEDVEKTTRGVGAVTQKLLDMGAAFTDLVSPIAELGLGSGSRTIFGDFSSRIDEASRGIDDMAKSANEAAGALSNVPSIFRANLRRTQSVGGGGSVASGGFGGGNMNFYGNVIVQGANPDEFRRHIQRRNFVAYGETYSGLAAASPLPAAG